MRSLDWIISKTVFFQKSTPRNWKIISIHIRIRYQSFDHYCFDRSNREKFRGEIKRRIDRIKKTKIRISKWKSRIKKSDYEYIAWFKNATNGNNRISWFYVTRTINEKSNKILRNYPTKIRRINRTYRTIIWFFQDHGSEWKNGKRTMLYQYHFRRNAVKLLYDFERKEDRSRN